MKDTKPNYKPLNPSERSEALAFKIHEVTAGASLNDICAACATVAAEAIYAAHPSLLSVNPRLRATADLTRRKVLERINRPAFK